MKNETISEYKELIAGCKEVFEKKYHDYGTAWRILRTESLTDQIFIKAKRIRSIQEKGVQLINEGVESEFLGIINYCIMALMQLELPKDEELELPFERVSNLYQKYADETMNLLAMKNHDYGEAWREMRVSSITDIILMKLLRVKQIEDIKGATIISEGVDANYQDIINYCVFALILMKKGK